MKRILAVLLFFLAVPAMAASPVVEINRLIIALGASGCDFQRNGTWYPAPKAEAHLRRKYDYLRDRGRVTSAEQFIELAGSRSSMSGRAYRVRCPGRPVVNSSDWLRDRLREMRGRDRRAH